MPNQSTHMDLVYYSTSSSVFSALTVIMFKCVSNSETLAYSTLSACGQRVDFITESEQRPGRKNNFFTIISTHTLYHPVSVIWIASSCTRDTTPVLTCLESEPEMPPAPCHGGQAALCLIQPPPTPQIWGDRLHFPSCWWFLRPQSECSATASDFSYLLLTCRSASRIHHRQLLSTVK